MRSGFVSVGIVWRQPILNFVGDHGSDECYLRVAEFSGLLALPGEICFYIESPKLLREHRFKVDVAEDGSVVWRSKGKSDRLERAQLADSIVQLFLELLSRANQGKVAPPHL